MHISFPSLIQLLLFNMPSAGKGRPIRCGSAIGERHGNELPTFGITMQDQAGPILADPTPFGNEI